jgi:two-component system sensor histidine kinase ArlS
MSVRLKITFLFSLIVFCILGLVCITVFYFSSKARRSYIDTRLTNMAITTGRFLSRAELFNPHLVQKIDSLTAIAFTRKTIQVYDSSNKKIYFFNDDDADTLSINEELLNKVRAQKKIYSIIGEKDVVYYNYTDEELNIVIVAAGYDIYGWQNLRQLFFILSISFFGGFLIAIISGYIFSRKLLKPLSKIADEVNEISVQSLARRMNTGSTHDEWYYLSDTLNQLLNRLQESFEMQQRFISNASHELSTPLTSISSQLEIALQRERTADEYKKVMQSIYQDIQQMGKLTHTLLELAKTSGSKGGIEIKPVRVDEIILRLPSEIAKINNSYSVLPEFEKLPENEADLLVLGNEELLVTAIKNIVLNACKYSENQQAIILLKADQKNITISIQNTGSGIPANEIENIFEPFYRIEENRTTGGFGLGLSLAQKIIKLHRGEISVDSRQGEITVFIIHLPSARNLKEV